MHIVSGKFRGRRLMSPEGRDIRPTSDMVKQAIFNILQTRIEGARVLDLFGGSGALGIEALSRGASEVVFCDRSPEACKLIRANLALIGSEAVIWQCDYLNALSRIKGQAFDIILIDPPYDSDFAAEAVSKIFEAELLAADGVIIAEGSAKKQLINLPKNAKITSTRRYGVKSLTIIVAA